MRLRDECYCDIKALFGTTGHDPNCGYVRAKKAKEVVETDDTKTNGNWIVRVGPSTVVLGIDYSDDTYIALSDFAQYETDEQLRKRFMSAMGLPVKVRS